MRWRNTETPTFAGSAGSGTAPSVAETLEAVDKDGNVVVAIAKSVAGAISMEINGEAVPSLDSVSSTELGYLDGVTSAIQTQLDAKQAAGTDVSATEVGYLNGVTSAIQTQLNAKADGTAGVKVYRALLTQTGTDAPTATVLENSLGGTPTYGYVDPGTYTVTLTGAFTANKTAFLMGPISDGSGQNAGAFYNNVNEAGIYTATLGTPGNGLLSGVLFEILIYP